MVTLSDKLQKQSACHGKDDSGVEQRPRFEFSAYSEGPGPDGRSSRDLETVAQKSAESNPTSDRNATNL